MNTGMLENPITQDNLAPQKGGLWFGEWSDVQFTQFSTYPFKNARRFPSTQSISR